MRRIATSSLLALAVALCFGTYAQAQTVVVPFAASGWHYKEVAWGAEPGFEAIGYPEVGFNPNGTAPFGSQGSCNFPAFATPWSVNTDLLLRRTITLPADAFSLNVQGTVDNDATVYVNGQQIGFVTSGFCFTNNINFTAPNSALVTGSNVLAIRGHDFGGQTFLDVQVTYFDCSQPPPGGAILGGAGNDRLTGTPQPDVIFSMGGNDRIDGLGGDDVICTGSGDDRVDAGDGADLVSGEAGNDRLIGSNGNDRLIGGTGNDTLEGFAGDDTLDGGADNDQCDGGAGTDSATACETVISAP